ncbi:hypothetical protein CSA80_01975 [Candidatus Saccharibacteria bacterium]|nr:MAG: hypothetical protein CSA80_01975 [Candidatus Saccharibacteria bacterium]
MISDKFFKDFLKNTSRKETEIVFKFFVTFSRFECALKSTIRFAYNYKNKAHSDWDSFTNSIEDSFNPEKDEKLDKATKFILENPPKIQVLEDDELKWVKRKFNSNDSDIHKLNLHIRDVRNNLFHGGKFKGGCQKDAARNFELIESSLIILNEWLKLDKDVKRNFLAKIT